jgi:hypothetical protein
VPKSRSRITAVVALGFLLASTATWLAHPGSVSAAACSGEGSPDNDFSGTVYEPLSDTQGTQAYIKYVDQTMCGGTPPDGHAFTTEWVAISGSYGLDIFQIGYLKCKSCPGIPESTLVTMWAYGRNPGGDCGATGINPSPKVIGIAVSGAPRLFKLEKADTRYEASIDGSIKGTKTFGDIETCWINGSVRRSTLFTEVFDQGQESGGSVSNNEVFSSVRWLSPTYWYPLTQALNTNCPVDDRISQHCRTYGTYTDAYYMWDSRFP